MISCKNAGFATGFLLILLFVGSIIFTKDITGVLAKIASNLTEEGISIETILQIPEKNLKIDKIPIIIVTHETTNYILMKAVTKIEKLDFVLNKIAVITIDKGLN